MFSALSRLLPRRPPPHPIRLYTPPPSSYTLTFERSSGPGGQNVNKVATKAVLKFDTKALEERVR